MIKRNIFLLAVIIPIIMCGCDKNEFTTTSTPVYFGDDNTVNLSSDKQEAELKASYPYWQMAIGYGEDNLKIEGDTICRDWYTLIKKNNGESLLIKVDKNEGEKRSLVISVRNENYYTRVILNQEGK